MTHAIPAATVIIVRDGPVGHAVLMIERHSQLAFAGGAAVFPGGRVDEDDRRIAAGTAPPDIDPEDAAARVAAIRESLEEAGATIGISGMEADTAREWRGALHAGIPFSSLLAQGGAMLDLATLTPFARWRPDAALKRIFDTRFYLARAGVEMGEPLEGDGHEAVRAFWVSPAEMLARAEEGRAHVIFPTRRNLERLAAHQGFAALRAHALRTPITTITSRVEQRDGEDWLTIPEGLGYPVTAERLATARRG